MQACRCSSGVWRAVPRTTDADAPAQSCCRHRCHDSSARARLQLFSTQTSRHSSTKSNMSASIDSETLKQYLADSPPTIVPLAIKPHFEALSDKEKLYAHHVSV